MLRQVEEWEGGGGFVAFLRGLFSAHHHAHQPLLPLHTFTHTHTHAAYASPGFVFVWCCCCPSFFCFFLPLPNLSQVTEQKITDCSSLAGRSKGRATQQSARLKEKPGPTVHTDGGNGGIFIRRKEEEEEEEITQSKYVCIPCHAANVQTTKGRCIGGADGFHLWSDVKQLDNIVSGGGGGGMNTKQMS